MVTALAETTASKWAQSIPYWEIRMSDFFQFLKVAYASFSDEFHSIKLHYQLVQYGIVSYSVLFPTPLDMT